MKVQSLNSIYVGYRTEGLYGEGYRDLRSVVNHEVDELDNPVLDVVKDLDSYIDSLYRKGYTETVWLVDSIEDFNQAYGSDEDYSFDKYTIKEPIILDDVGIDGKLVAYKPGNLEINYAV